MTYTVINHERGNEREFESRSEAEEAVQEVISLGADPSNVELKEANTDGGEALVSDTVDTQDLPDDPAVDEDPLDYMPSHFIDDIQGTPAINRKGYAVLASHYNIGVKAEPVVRASETDFEYAEFQAVAVTEDGTEYSGFGSAHIARMDGDDQYLLNELAETRACKRALALATGVGVVSAEEMRGSL